MEKENKNFTKKPVVEEAVQAPASNMPPLNQDQLDYLFKMLEQSKNTGSQGNGFSVYGQRDPRKIETVNVKRFEGKFVVGFVDFQNDPFKKHVPKYTTVEFDPIRKIDFQPYITLVLSDGSENADGELVTTERKVRLLDYVDYRERFDAKVIRIEKKDVIDNYGQLGGHAMASEIDAKGNKISYPSINKETKREVMTFFVELPGFSKPVEFINDPVGPLG